MEEVSLSSTSPVSVIAQRPTIRAREAAAQSVAKQLVVIESNEKIENLLGILRVPALDVRPFCSTVRARRALTANGMWNIRALLKSTIPEILELRNCGPRTAEDILTALLLSMASPIQHHFPIGDSDELGAARLVKAEEAIEPLTARGFMAAIRGRRSA
ncbi:hypothetical protein [Streptomyces sp. N50]|uniref:hypothetical protein n=1 Tax=Streptomyces sp. N50 TaxID=3081765 RepID=UPI002962195F|nr:hypothetical protein [Streptomyces sp. N50]WOX11425.1 hypothetical protein R2B38_22495 [Streptomyces sp. N50]